MLAFFAEEVICYGSLMTQNYDMASSPEGDINTALKQKHFDKTHFKSSRKA